MARRRWKELFRSLGSAFLELLQAELDSLGRDLGASGKKLAKAVALIFVAAVFTFWTLGVLTYSLIEILALWLPRWGAALTLTGLLLLVVAALAGGSWWILRRMESPAGTVRRHVDDHLDWWHQRVVERDRALGAGEPPEVER